MHTTSPPVTSLFRDGENGMKGGFVDGGGMFWGSGMVGEAKRLGNRRTWQGNDDRRRMVGMTEGMGMKKKWN